MEALKNLHNLHNLQRVQKQEAREEIKTTTTTAEIQEIEFKKKILFVEVVSLEAYEALEIACKQLVKDCQEGLQDTLQQFYFLRKMQDTLEETILQLQPLAIDKAISLHKDELKGLEIGYTAEILDFSDPEIKRLETALKERKEKIKLATKGHTIMDETTGEIIKPATIKTPSKPYLKLCKK